MLLDSVTKLLGVFLAPKEEEIRKVESLSANFHGNARSLGKLACIMANKGKKINEEGRILSEDVWEQMHNDSLWALDAVLGIIFEQQHYVIPVCNIISQKFQEEHFMKFAQAKPR